MLSAFRSDQLVEVFSFKLRAAWLDHLENYILGCTKYNLHAFPLYFNVIISYSFTTAIPPLPRLQKKRGLQTCHPPFWIYYPIFISHFDTSLYTLEACSPCNMLIQLLSFKYDVCHKEFEPKSAASWNATSSCLLSSCHTIPRGQLCMLIASFYELLKISLALHTCNYWNYF